MATSSEEVPTNNETAGDRRSRAHRGREFQNRVLRAIAAGMSRAEAKRRYRVSNSTLCRWIRKHEQEAGSVAPEANFQPVRIVGSGGGDGLRLRFFGGGEVVGLTIDDVAELMRRVDGGRS